MVVASPFGSKIRSDHTLIGTFTPSAPSPWVLELSTTLRPLTPSYSLPRHGELRRGENMKTTTAYLTFAAVLAILIMAGCTSAPEKSPDVSDSIRKSLDQAGLKNVSVSQDRDKGVVTLTGNVATDSDKGQAESIAKSIASGQVVANQIAVLPPGAESDAKTVNSDLDKAIDKNLDAALVKNGMKGLRYDVKNGVVTLKGEVNSQAKRAQVEKVAAGVPNVKQVVNELQVKEQKASSTKQ
jgi:hyperosmotically inducible periplasmic protein